MKTTPRSPQIPRNPLYLFHIGVIAVTMAVSCPRASAVLLASEGFNYTQDTSLLAKNGGTGFSGAWNNMTGGTTDVEAGLTYPSLGATGGSAFLTPTSAPSNTIFRSLGATYGGTIGDTYYLSFLATKNTGSRYFGLSLYSGATERALFGQTSGSTVWGMQAGTTAATGVSSIDTSTDFIVVKLVYTSATNANLSMYVNPTIGGVEPGSPAASSSMNGTFSSIRLGAGYDNGTHTTSIGSIDEFRLGTTWGDVTSPVPEPGVCALFAVGTGFLLLRRKGRTAK